MKNYSAEIREALKNGNAVESVIEMRLASGNIFLTTAAHDIIYNGVNYIGSGLVFAKSSIKSTKQMQISNIRMQFSAVDQSLMAIFLNNRNKNRKVIITDVILDATNKPLGALYQSSFLIKGCSFEQGSDISIFGLTLSNHLSLLKTVKGISSTQNSFSRFYPQTTSFINSKDFGKPLKWGGR